MWNSHTPCHVRLDLGQRIGVRHARDFVGLNWWAMTNSGVPDLMLAPRATVCGNKKRV